MDTLRKEAYRHLVYVAMLDMRSSPPSPRWWSLRRWRQIFQETCRVKQLADAFHNIARYSAHDFEHFDENRFWKDLDCTVRESQGRVNFDYREIFSDYLDGKKWP